MDLNTNKLRVYKKAHELVLKTYEVTKLFPKDEHFGLTSQLRRAAISIPSNISEGKARGSDKDYKRFLFMARGSLEEVKYQYLLAKDLKYIDESQYNTVLKLANDIGRMLNGLITTLDK